MHDNFAKLVTIEAAKNMATEFPGGGGAPPKKLIPEVLVGSFIKVLVRNPPLNGLGIRFQGVDPPQKHVP